MALGPRLDLRQSQSLVMTPQLQQAIKLLTLSNLEIETVIGEAIEGNPLLELGTAAAEPVAVETADPRRTTLETSPIDQLIGEGRAADDRPLDIDPGALDRDRDTGDGALAIGDRGDGPVVDDWAANDWAGSDTRGGEGLTGSGGEAPDIAERGPAGITLADHLHAQVGPSARDPVSAAIAHALVDQLDEAGYLTLPLAELAGDLRVTLEAAEAGLTLLQSLDPTGVGARNLAECLALQAREADRYDPCMARLLDNLDLLGRGELARLKRMCGVDDEDFAEMLAELRGYDPRPGLRFATGGGEAVVPDVLVRARTDPAGAFSGWDIAINPVTLPKLVINRSYYVERQVRARLAVGKARRRQLAGQGARPAAENDPQGRRRDRHPAGRVLPKRRRASPAADPAHRGRGDRHARIDRQPRHFEQVPALRARDLRIEVLLHLGRGLVRRRGRGLGRGGESRDPSVDRGRRPEGDPVRRHTGRPAQGQGLRPRPPDGGQIPRGNRARQFGAAAAAEGAGGNSLNPERLMMARLTTIPPETLMTISATSITMLLMLLRCVYDVHPFSSAS